MTIRYVGIGGNDGNDGLSWANRKLTLNGVEDTPVAAGDTVYVGPGVYRELLTVDVSGTAGNPITYIGDVTGAYTDGIGGVVRITGSDNDTTATRANCITASGKGYRAFTGFAFDLTTGVEVTTVTTACDYWTISRCSFMPCASTNLLLAIGSAHWTVEQCFFWNQAGTVCLIISNGSTVNDTGTVIQNCIFLNGSGAVQVTRVGGVVVKNCDFLGRFNPAVEVLTALASGQTLTVNNCIFQGAVVAVKCTTAAEFVEDYNSFFGNSTDRTTVSAGANSNAYPPLFATPLLGTSIRYPWMFGALSEWSAARGIAGTGETTTDIFGITRPATAAKNSWGPVQYVEPRRDTGTKRTGAASLKLPDAGRHQMFVPTANASTVFSCYVYWGADYAGTKPQMVVKQPGQSDTTVTATGSAGNWEQLTTTLTPAASPSYCIVEFVSNNTATSGSYSVFIDDLTVT